MLRRLLMPIFLRIARSLGITEIQSRIDALERSTYSLQVSDDTYAAIEERFRGSPELIKQRQSQYVPHVRRIATVNAPALDLGSGRGEWLSLLRESNIPGRGIDSNRQFVERGRASGLQVEEADITSYLSQQQSQSIGVVTMFQVAEHLPLGVLEHVLAEIHRVLIPGGLAIIEIPNLKTTRVGSGTFWIDPTHIRPLFPDFLIFLVERAGFGSIQAIASTPLDDSLSLHVTDTQSQMVQTLWEQVNGPGDFAVIATK